MANYFETPLMVDGHEADDRTVSRQSNMTSIACNVAIEMAAGVPDARINYTAPAEPPITDYPLLALTDLAGFLNGDVAALAAHPIYVDSSAGDLTIQSLDHATLGETVVLFVPSWASGKVTIVNQSATGTPGELFNGHGHDLELRTGLGAVLVYSGTEWTALE